MKGFQSIVKSHLSRYPLIQIEDLYKLTYQAALGSEHAVMNIQSARDWLFHELDNMLYISTNSLYEEISPDGQIMRVHLKPYVEWGGDPELLLQAFVQTANGFKGSIDKYKQYWLIIEALAENNEINFRVDDIRNFNHKMGSLDYPAEHHSRQFKNAYNPHYRVVARDYIQEIIPGLLG